MMKDEIEDRWRRMTFFRPHGKLVMKSKGCGRELSSCACNGSEM